MRYFFYIFSNPSNFRPNSGV